MAAAAGRGPAAVQGQEEEEVEMGELPLEEGASEESEEEVADPVAAYILGRPPGGGAVPRPSRFRELAQPRPIYPRAPTRRVSSL